MHSPVVGNISKVFYFTAKFQQTNICTFQPQTPFTVPTVAAALMTLVNCDVVIVVLMVSVALTDDGGGGGVGSAQC